MHLFHLFGAIRAGWDPLLTFWGIWVEAITRIFRLEHLLQGKAYSILQTRGK